jgi:CheY-like chemotaxis protein
MNMTDTIGLALIDDDEAVLDALQRYLARQKIHATGFRLASDFLAAMERGEQFECVVSDIRMPGALSARQRQKATRAPRWKSCLHEAIYASPKPTIWDDRATSGFTSTIWMVLSLQELEASAIHWCEATQFLTKTLETLRR